MPPFLLYDDAQAQALRDATQGLEWAVDPVPIRAGAHVGLNAVSPAALTAPALAPFLDLIQVAGNPTPVNAALAWPPIEEPSE